MNRREVIKGTAAVAAASVLPVIPAIAESQITARWNVIGFDQYGALHSFTYDWHSEFTAWVEKESGFIIPSIKLDGAHAWNCAYIEWEKRNGNECT